MKTALITVATILTIISITMYASGKTAHTDRKKSLRYFSERGMYPDYSDNPGCAMILGCIGLIVSAILFLAGMAMQRRTMTEEDGTKIAAVLK